MKKAALFSFVCVALLLGAGCTTNSPGGEPSFQGIPAAGGEQSFIKEDEGLFPEERGAIEITGSGENGRVLHKDVIYQRARPGDYITVFSGKKLDAPRPLTQGDIDYSKSQYKDITDELRDTSPGSVRDLLDTLIDESGLDSADGMGPATGIEPVDLSQIRGKGIKEFISDVRDGIQRILIVMDPENSAFFDGYYTTPPWKKETASEGGDHVFMLAKRVNSAANEIFCMTEDIQVTKTLIRKIIDAAPPPPPPRTSGSANLMTEFRVGSVTAAFNAIHEFLQTCNGKPNRAGVIRSRILPGDYLDLPALTVKKDSGGGGFSAVNTSLGEHGTLLRLIVVGVDSFGKTNSEAPAHIVFQFQNVPVNRRMNRSDTNKGGYAKSEMRSYLKNRFLPGLVAAGLPESIIWAPTRYIANGGDKATAADALADKLWLPTERELFGSNTFSNGRYETVQNQARLEFYESDEKRVKYNLERKDFYGMWYWEASPYSGSAAAFVHVDTNGRSGNSGNGFAYIGYGPSVEGGCAPAFCVR